MLKRAGDLAMALLFVVTPVIARLTKRQPLGAYTPSIWYLATIALMIVLGQLTHLLAGAGLGPGWLTRNLSEFRELMIYYTGALYLRDLVRARQATGTSRPAIREESELSRAA